MRTSDIKLILACLCALLLSGTAGSDQQESLPYEPDAAVAVVNGEEITVARFGEKLVTELGFSVIDDIVRRKLVEQEARKRGLTVTEAELAARRKLEARMRMRYVAASTRLTMEDLEEFFNRSESSLAAETAAVENGIPDSALRVQALAERMCNDKVMLTDLDIEDYHAKTRGLRFLAAHIVVAHKDAAEAIAARLSRRRSGVVRHLFPELVQRISMDRASVPWGGRIQPLTSMTYLGSVLRRMAPNEVKIVKNNEKNFWHVLKLLKRIPPEPGSVDDMKDELRAELRVLKLSSEIDRWVQQLMADAHIVYNLSDNPAQRKLLGADVVVFVNGEPIYRQELAQALLEQFGDRALEEIINEKLVFQYAKRHGINITPDQVEARIEEMIDDKIEEEARSRGMTVEELHAELRKMGLRLDRYRDTIKSLFISHSRVKAFLISRHLARKSVNVTEEDVEREYQAKYGKRKFVEDLTVESRDKAVEIRRELNQGADFNELRRIHGLSAVGARDRRKGPITPSHEYWTVVENLRHGQTSDIFQASDGLYHIVLVQEEAPEKTPPALADVREELRREVDERRMNLWMRVWLEHLRKQARIEKTPLSELKKRTN